MNKLIIRSLALLALTTIACSGSGNASPGKADTLTSAPADMSSAAAPAEASEPAEPTSTSAARNQLKSNLPAGAQALLDAYPDFLRGYENGKLIFADGTTMTYDDGRKKDFETMLDDSDPEDMFYVKYTEPSGSPEYLADAGRSRCEALFKKMYGSSSAAVQKKLVNVPWFGQTVKFTSANGAAEQLKKVAAELAKYPELKKYLKSSGTFYWRKVRGANRLSAHSYGIAFDIGVDNSDYWLWKNPGAKETTKIKYHNRVPRKIVEIFRKHGFIWGGSWYHYDTMHFEYRPEILRYAELSEN